MSDRWNLESAGSVKPAYSLDQLRTMFSSGLLKPTDMVVREGSSESIRVDELLTSQPVGATIDVAPTQSFKPRRSARWVAIGVAGVLLLGGAAAIVVYSMTKPIPPSADLPEWFDPAYHIQKKRGIIFASKSGDKAKNDARVQAPAGMYNDAWLDEHFTHYIGKENAFTWTAPRLAYPSDGKIMAGIKAIVGWEANGISLICVLTEDGRPENMYVPTERLIERSQGPPMIDAD